MSESLESKVAVLETKVNQHDELLNKQIEKNELQVEMNTLLKMQIDANKEQNKQMEKFAETMDKVDINLTNLNNAQLQLQNKLTHIDTRVGKIEQASDDNKIDPMKVFKWAIGGLGAIIITVVSTYLVVKFGLK